MNKSFKFDFAFQTLEKAANADKGYPIGGIVSTDHLDRQDEVLIQEGLDFGPFLEKGYFNDNHESATGAAVGVPTKAELINLPGGKKGWYVEGYLLKGHSRAEEIYGLAKSLEGTDRNLGFSVEGSIEKRDAQNPNVVLKAVVREVAVTRCPVNTQTSLSVLAKSLATNAGSDGGTPGDGGPLQVQSLETDDEEEEAKKKKAKSKLTLAMTKADAVKWLKGHNPNISDDLAEWVVEFASRRVPVKE